MDLKQKDRKPDINAINTNQELQIIRLETQVIFSRMSVLQQRLDKAIGRKNELFGPSKMYKFLAEQRTNLLLNRIVQTVEDIGVHNLEEQDYAILHAVFQQKRPTEKFCKRAEDFHKLLKVKYGSLLLTEEERKKANGPSSLVSSSLTFCQRVDRLLKAHQRAQQQAQISQEEKFYQSYKLFPGKQLKSKTGGTHRSHENISSLELGGKVKMLHEVRPKNHNPYQLYLRHALPDTFYYKGFQKSPYQWSLRLSGRFSQNRNPSYKKKKQGLMVDGQSKVKKSAFAKEANDPEDTRKFYTQVKPKNKLQNIELNKIDLGPDGNSNADAMNRSHIDAELSFLRTTNSQSKDVMQVERWKKAKLKMAQAETKIIDVGFWMRPFGQKYENENRIRLEQGLYDPSILKKYGDKQITEASSTSSICQEIFNVQKVLPAVDIDSLTQINI